MGAQHNIQNSVKNVLTDEWNSIFADKRKKLVVHTMPQSIPADIKAKGGPTKYSSYYFFINITM